MHLSLTHNRMHWPWNYSWWGWSLCLDPEDSWLIFRCVNGRNRWNLVPNPAATEHPALRLQIPVWRSVQDRQHRSIPFGGIIISCVCWGGIQSGWRVKNGGYCWWVLGIGLTQVKDQNRFQTKNPLNSAEEVSISGSADAQALSNSPWIPGFFSHSQNEGHNPPNFPLTPQISELSQILSPPWQPLDYQRQRVCPTFLPFLYLAHPPQQTTQPTATGSRQRTDNAVISSANKRTKAADISVAWYSPAAQISYELHFYPITVETNSLLTSLFKTLLNLDHKDTQPRSVAQKTGSLYKHLPPAVSLHAPGQESANNTARFPDLCRRNNAVLI